MAVFTPHTHRPSRTLIPTTDKQVRHGLFAFIFIMAPCEVTVSQQTKPECKRMAYQLQDYMNETSIIAAKNDLAKFEVCK
jgi:hypothetical protein